MAIVPIVHILSGLLLVVGCPALARAQTPAGSPSYFGASTSGPGASGASSGKAPAVNEAIRRELQTLADRHAAEIARAAEPIDKRYQAELQPLIKRAQEAGDTETVQKIKDLIAKLGNLDGTTWHHHGNAWVVELRFRNGMMYVVPGGGAPPRLTPYKVENGSVVFMFDDRLQQIAIAPDHSSLTWEGIVFDP